jgi:glycosyl transferase family 25
MSHHQSWEKIAASDASFGLVLEDDIHVSDALPSFLADTRWIPQDADIVRLESTGQWLALGKPVANRDGRAVRVIRSAAWGAGAYLLSKGAARRLMAADPLHESPTDDYLFNLPVSPVARAMKTYQLVPALAVQDKFSAHSDAIVGFGSDIETDQVNQRLRGLKALRRQITSIIRGKSSVEFA